MASGAFTNRRLRSSLRIGQWMMAESEEPPAIGFRKPFAVFHRYVDPVVLTIEKTATRWFSPRTVWKGRIEYPGQLFHKHCSFGKGTRLQVSINIFLLDVYVVIFRESRFAIIESIRRYRSAHKNPLTKTRRQFQLTVGIELRRRLLLRFSRNLTSVE